MKKALIRNAIYDWIDENNLKKAQEVFSNSKALYEYLRNHKHFGDLLPKNMTYVHFMEQMEVGFHLSKVRF